MFRIFVIEDNFAEFKLIEAAIRDAGLEKLVITEHSMNGDESLAKIDENRFTDSVPDLILLDLNLPCVSGKEILSKIRNIDEYNNTLVFILSNSDYHDDLVDCMNLKADGFIQKPSDYFQFVDFFISVKKSMEISNRLSANQIQNNYKQLILSA